MLIQTRDACKKSSRELMTTRCCTTALVVALKYIGNFTLVSNEAEILFKEMINRLLGSGEELSEPLVERWRFRMDHPLLHQLLGVFGKLNSLELVHCRALPVIQGEENFDQNPSLFIAKLPYNLFHMLE